MMEGWKEPGVERLPYRSTVTGSNIPDLDNERSDDEKREKELSC